MKRSGLTEKRILHAALALFVKNGYHGTSINDITKEVGLTKGALYAHFQNKGELLLKIIDEFRIEYIEKMIKTVDAHPGNAIDKLNCAISFSSRFALENPDLCLFLTFLTTELNTDVDFEPALKSVYRDYQKFISELIRDGIRQGLINPGLDPELAALTFMAIHDGVLHQWALNRDRIDGEKYVKTFRFIFVKGLMAQEQEEGGAAS
ncbi:TetR/AcrR family transcriptional regulator [Desulfatiglans anilini]|uniref:TetR/AcrR family transcriptional regulator n=1 Tax=Desulfatiglans anilini TaxID=90728 RepID=UPI0004899E79|nr:TetR/AcrR family transcriptional regulator [Desulfatiglans anilini]